jgi:sialic acid synthase SpsE
MLERELKIGRRTIGAGTPPFIIAEAGSNHGQSLDTALRLVDAAARTGVDVVKFQLFQADALYPSGGEMHALFKSLELSRDWVPRLKAHAEEQGLLFMASAFDRGSVDVLEQAGVAAHKVASSEATHFALLAHIARAGKPMIVSTGMCDLVDVSEAVTVCEEMGNRSLVLLQCGTVYPLPPDQVHLRAMDLMHETFGCPVGFSDHTLGIHASVAAVARGAAVIEKHFTLDRQSPGPDHFYALEPAELEALVRACRETYSALGSRTKELLPEEKRLGRREGLYAARDLPRGTRLAASDIASKRPATGIRARHRDKVVGATLKEDVRSGEALEWQKLEL